MFCSLPFPGIATVMQAKTVFLAAAPRGVPVGAVFRKVGAFSKCSSLLPWSMP